MSKAKPQPAWTVQRHGGGRRNGWREAFTGNEKPARNQVYLHGTQMAQGGVRLLNPQGVIVEAWWRRHAPGARVERIRFCIGCGCDDLHACEDDISIACSWVVVDKKTATGVCSSCIGRALKRWKNGDREVRAVPA